MFTSFFKKNLSFSFYQKLKLRLIERLKSNAMLAIAVDARRKHITNKQEKKNWVASHNVSGLIKHAGDNTAESTEQWLIHAIELNPELEFALLRTFFMLYKDSDPDVAVKYGRRVVELGADKQFEKVYNTRSARVWKSTIKGSEYSDLLIQAKTLIEDGRSAIALELYQQIESEETKFRLGKAIFTQFKDSHTIDACSFIKPLIAKIDDQKLIKVVAARFYSIKDMDTAAQLYAKHLEVDSSELIIERFAIAYSGSCDISNISNFTRADCENMLGSLLPANLSIDVYNAIVDWMLYLLLKHDTTNSALAKEAAYALIKRGFSKVSLSWSKHLFSQGHIDEAMKRCDLNPSEPSHLHQLHLLNGYKILLENGMPMPNRKGGHVGTSKKVLFTLYNSLPVHSAGYAARAHGLMTELQKKGYVCNALTRLGYPQDLRNFRDKPVQQVEYVDSVAYHRLPTPTEGNGFIPLNEYLLKYADKIIEHCQSNQVGLLHSASNFVNGIATNYAAKSLGIKSIYEVRGLWEVTRVSRQPKWHATQHYEMIKRLETESALHADHVITITQALKNEMVKRGVNENKITVVPNGVDTARFALSTRCRKLEERYALENQVVIGYVGSMVDYEGLDLLVRAAALLKKRNISGFHLLLIGDGAVKVALEQQVQDSGLSDIVIFTGRVPHNVVEDYYSLIDICPFPRKGLPVCEMVSPLKPFEAMAMGKAVVSSDVDALAEIVQDGITGLLHKKGCAHDLADKLQLLIEQPDLRDKCGIAAREWVVAERDWEVLAKRVDAVYKKLLGCRVDEETN